MWAADFASTGIHPPCTATPILNFLPGMGSPAGIAAAAVGTPYPGAAGPGAMVAGGSYPAATNHTGGVIVSYADGHRAMAFLFDCSHLSTTCMVLGHLGLSWLLRDAIPGVRQALLTVHVDDMLASTPFVTPLPLAPNATADANATMLRAYRATLPDLLAHKAWQAQLNAQLPAGSRVAIELAFNGNGVMEAYAEQLGSSSAAGALVVDNRACHAKPEYTALGCNRTCWMAGTEACPTTQPPLCRNCTKDWAKPRGYGTDKVPQHALNTTERWAAAIAADPVAAAIASDSAEGIPSAFFWSSHTFTHQQLDNATYGDAELQFRLNLLFAGQVGVHSQGLGHAGL